MTSKLTPARSTSVTIVPAGLPDPRSRRGMRHTLTSLVLAAVAAVLAGARSFTAIGERAADAPPRVLAALGVSGLRGGAGYRKIDGFLTARRS